MYPPLMPNTKIDGETALAWQIPATAAADIETTHKMCLELRSEEEKERCPFWLINKRHSAGCLPLWGPKSFDSQMFFHGEGSGKATEGNLPFLGCFCAQLKMAGFCILGPWCHDFGSSLVFKAREYRCIKVVFSRVHDTWPQEQVPKLCLCTYSFNVRV